MGSHSKNKGKGGEREVVKLFRDALGSVVDPEEIRRNHQQAEIGGADLVGIPYFSVEVKRVRQISWGKQVDDWWDQTCQQASDERKWPCLVFRQDHGNWFVMVYSYGTHFGEEFVLTRTIMLWKDFEEYLARFRVIDND